MAYNALAILARLPLHPFGGKPRAPEPNVCKSSSCDDARRSLARSRMDVRRLGRHPRCSAYNQPYMEHRCSEGTCNGRILWRPNKWPTYYLGGHGLAKPGVLMVDPCDVERAQRRPRAV